MAEEAESAPKDESPPKRTITPVIPGQRLGAASARSPPKWAQTILSNRSTREHFCKQFYKQFDKNRNNQLELPEVYQLIKSICEQMRVDPPTSDRVRRLFILFDKNHSSTLTEDEFPNFFYVVLRGAVNRFDPEFLKQEEEREKQRAKEFRDSVDRICERTPKELVDRAQLFEAVRSVLSLEELHRRYEWLEVERELVRKDPELLRRAELLPETRAEIPLDELRRRVKDLEAIEVSNQPARNHRMSAVGHKLTTAELGTPWLMTDGAGRPAPRLG